MQALMQDAPWLDPQTGAAVLRLPDNRDIFNSLLTQGWLSDAGGDAFWGGEGVASIRIPVMRTGADYQIKLNAKPFLASANDFRQRVIISIGGEKLQEQVLDRDQFTQIKLTLPANRLVSPWTRITLEFPDALVPAEVGESQDRRRLGLAIIGLEIIPAEWP